MNILVAGATDRTRRLARFIPAGWLRPVAVTVWLGRRSFVVANATAGRAATIGRLEAEGGVMMRKTPMTRGGRSPGFARGAAALALGSVLVGAPGALAQPAGGPPAPAGGGAAAEPAVYREVLDRYCVACHNQRTLAGGLALDAADLAQVGGQAEQWEKVLRKLRTRAMPPPGRPRPAPAVYDAFGAWLERSLDQWAADHPDPGRPAIHRLNRLEYANAVRDLLHLDIDGQALLPADDLAFGFDNNADVLTVAPGLFARYLSAARAVSRLAVADPSIEPDVVRYPVSPLLAQDGRMSEDLPFGSRGGAAVRHHFPRDGDYELRIELRGNRGRNEPQEIDVRLDGERIALLRAGRWPEGAPAEAPAAAAGGDELAVRFAARAGTRLVSVSFLDRTMAPEGVAPARLPLWTFSTGRGYVEPMALDGFEIEGPWDAEAAGAAPAGAAAGGRGVFLDAEAAGAAPAAPGRRGVFPAAEAAGAAPAGAAAGGRGVFLCEPAGAADEEACAERILEALARRAFHRPVTDDDVQALLAFYREGREQGGFRAGVRRAIESILVDPEFLFRIERDPPGAAPGTAYRLSGVELAARLSFFLWASIPDDELLDAAVAGRLSDPRALEAQVRRMLADERAETLVTSFAAQWLHLRRMRTVAPDVNAFPAFDENLREALIRETELFVASQLRDDRSVVEMLTADYTFVNERLARHYGIPGVYGSRFRRVKWNDDRRRGLLGQGSILTVTSLATRTSPVVRGKWILENLLGAPPPPPPPDVPELPERAAGGEAASLRARLEAHRANPVCSNCHARMDPLGFALENFDAVGRWRETDAGGAPIDASGALPDGAVFDGLPALRGVLHGRRDEFVAAVTEKLLTYALGRGVEHYDRPAIRAIVREAARDDYRWSSIVLGIARSLPFQMRRSES